MAFVVAKRLVEEGVAPDAAVGWAARNANGWEVGEGRWPPSDFEPIFDLASLTKPMTALALHKSGIARSTPLGALLREARGTPSEHATLELLVAHRAGLEAHIPLFTERPANPLVRIASARRPECVGAEIPADGFPPVYSDLGPMLVGAALARGRGAIGVRGGGGAVDAGAVIEELATFAPEIATVRTLKRRINDFDKRVRPTEGDIRGHVHDENAWELTGLGGSGHAGMFGTVRSVIAFGQYVLDHLAELDWMVRPRPGGTLRAGFDGKSETGYSSAGSVCGPRTFGHLGFTGTSLWIDPDANALVVVLTNRVHPTRENLRIREARPLAHDALFRIATKDR